MPAAKVGVVSTTGCPYCKKAKDMLSKQGVEYAEAQLGEARDVLAKVKEATGQGTVPQIFIGGEFIGGASELQQLLDNGSFKDRLSSAKQEAFPRDIASLIDKHVAATGEQGPSKEEQHAAKLAELLARQLEWPEQEVQGYKCRAESAEKIAETLQSAGEDGARAATIMLQQRELAPAAPDDGGFDATSATRKYQLACFARQRGVKKGKPLNEHIPWWGAARSASAISADLRGRILTLYDAHLASDGTAVDYDGISQDPNYARYVNATAELTKADLSELSREERMAFFINIYNALIIHATVELGAPANLLKRLTFFGDAIYRIGEHTFSANDIEHGILRDNATSPASVGALINFGPLKKPQLGDGDKRKQFCITPLDPRIHFALVCGAKSCPPIKLYTPDNLNEGLQEAATAFCNGEIEIDATTQIITLSKIFKWYAHDFAVEPHQRLKVWASYASGTVQDELNQLAACQGKVRFKYKAYDWSSNSK